MKKLTSLICLVAIIAGVSLMTLSSCKKDKIEDPPFIKDFRVKTVNYTEDGDSFVTTFSYNSSNKITLLSEKVNGVEEYKSEWNWNDNIVTVVESYIENENWVTSEYVEKLTYSNGHIVKSEYSQSDTLESVSTYTWNGDKLINETFSMVYADSLIEVYEINYNYEGDLLISADQYSMGALSQKQVIEYTNGKPVALRNYDGNNVLQESSEFIRTGDNITKINQYAIIEGVQGDITCTEDRIFDANNCATSVTTACTNQGSYIQTATYEEGTGNLNDFLLTQISWISVYLFPDSFPSELAYKKKK